MKTITDVSRMINDSLDDTNFIIQTVDSNHYYIKKLNLLFTDAETIGSININESTIRNDLFIIIIRDMNNNVKRKFVVGEDIMNNLRFYRDVI